jgi:hypothetical protein
MPARPLYPSRPPQQQHPADELLILKPNTLVFYVDESVDQRLNN